MVNRGVFIVSTGRCGSTLLSRALAIHPRMLSLSEYFTVLRSAGVLSWKSLDGSTLLRHLSTPTPDLIALMRHSAAIPELIGAKALDAAPLLAIPLAALTDDPQQLLAELGNYLCELPIEDESVQHGRLFEWLAQRLQRQHWIERSGGSAAYVEQLICAWPAAKFVLLARRGPQCALSMSRHPFFRVKLARILAEDPALPVDACLARDLPLDRFGTLWSADMLRADRVIRHLPPQQRLLVRYEDLLEQPVATLRALAEFIEPGTDHAAWACAAAELVHAAPRALPVTPALEAACRAGMRIYQRMSDANQPAAPPLPTQGEVET